MNTPPTFEDLDALPVFERFTVQPDQIDDRGHMNIRFYFDASARSILGTCEALGMGGERRDENGQDGFTAEHHIRYYDELRLGDAYSTRVRVLGLSDKAVSMMAILVDESHGRVASTLESTLVNVDLTTRRVTTMSAAVAAQMRARLEHDDELPWWLETYGRLTADRERRNR